MNAEPADHRAGPHDIGGFAAGPVDPADHERELWQRRTESLVNLARAAGVGPLDEIRRPIESMGDRYAGTGYYERMLEALAATLAERGVPGLAELRRRWSRGRDSHRATRSACWTARAPAMCARRVITAAGAAR